MDRLVRLLLSLGASGAVDNARAALAERVRDDWIVDVLVSRLERAEQLAVSATRAA